MLPNVALSCPKFTYFTLSCPTLPSVALSYPKVGLYCSKAEIRVPGWVVGGGGVGGGEWCKPIIVANLTLVELC